MDQRVIRAYTHHYQHGAGAILVYRMPRRGQCGDGFGESVRSALRYIIPAVTSGVDKFGTEMLDRTERGEKFGRAARQAIVPALMAAKDRVMQRWKERRQKPPPPATDQQGTGSKKHRKRVYKATKSHKKKSSKRSHKKKSSKRAETSNDNITNF